MRIRVRKWYLDCSAPDGSAAVVYLGRVTLGPLRAPYAAVLVRDGSSASRHRTRYSSAATITDSTDRLVLEAPALGLSGAWIGRAPEFSRTLLDDAGCRIDWRCRMPRADVSMRLRDGRAIGGVGYAEYLEFEGSTRGMPFQQLRWGRFIGGERSVVWIDWTGTLERHWLFVDGRAVEAAGITEQRITWPGGQLEIDAGGTMRDAPVGGTVGGWFGRWLPRALADATETKWAASARLIEGAVATGGLVIHEVVRWG